MIILVMFGYYMFRVKRVFEKLGIIVIFVVIDFLS